jgi:hypothetical protein
MLRARRQHCCTPQDVGGQGSDSINWGYWYVTAPAEAGVLTAVTNSATACRSAFQQGAFASLPDDGTFRPADDNW